MVTEETAPPQPEVRAEIQEVLTRAKQGDTAVVPRLRELLTQYPVLWERHGDLAAQVELSWIALAAGDNLRMKESIVLYANKLRAELTRASASPVEKLLVERAVATWLQVNFFSGIEAAGLDGKLSPKLLEYRGKRQAQAQRMHERALAALLAVQKLFPAPVVLTPTTVATSTPVEVEQQQDATTERRRVVADVSDPAEADTEISQTDEQVRVVC